MYFFVDGTYGCDTETTVHEWNSRQPKLFSERFVELDSLQRTGGEGEKGGTRVPPLKHTHT